MKHYLSFVLLPCLFASCDIWYMQTFQGYDTKRVELQSETNTTSVSCSYFQGCYYLHYGLNGDCTVNYDSLKLRTNDDNLMVSSYLPDTGVHDYKLRKEWCLYFRIAFNRKDPSLKIVQPLVLSILPSDFITYNGKRITDDTLRVELKPGLNAYR